MEELAGGLAVPVGQEMAVLAHRPMGGAGHPGRVIRATFPILRTWAKVQMAQTGERDQ